MKKGMSIFSVSKCQIEPVLRLRFSECKSQTHQLITVPSSIAGVKGIDSNHQSYCCACVLYFVLITKLAVNTACFRESDNSTSFFQTFESFLSRKTASLEQTMGRTAVRISPTVGSTCSLILSEFQDGRGKMGWRNVQCIRLKCSSTWPTKLTSLEFCWNMAPLIRYGKKCL